MSATPSMFDLTGRTALVTGAGYGLGRALVGALAAHGARVIGVARSEDALRETFGPLGPDHRFLVGDLTGDEVYDRLQAHVDDVDILVNNAGGDPHSKPWREQTMDEWRETLEINLIASTRLCYQFVPAMAERGWGRVINVSSIYGSLGQDPRAAAPDRGAGAYAAAKHGVIGLTHYLATQVAKDGVTVNALSPAGIIWKPASEAGQAVRERNARHNPTGRSGEPDDYVGAVVFLASDAARFVNGHNLVVDGGWSIW